MANLVSFVILLCFFYGRSLRYNDRRRHIQWMSLVILADVSLIAYLVIERNALGKVNSTMSMPLAIHLAFAVTTVLLYGLAVYVGVGLVKKKPWRRSMRAIDRVLVPCRVLTLVTSVYLQYSTT